jgi:hypothetical protein
MLKALMKLEFYKNFFYYLTLSLFIFFWSFSCYYALSFYSLAIENFIKKSQNIEIYLFSNNKNLLDRIKKDVQAFVEFKKEIEPNALKKQIFEEVESTNITLDEELIPKVIIYKVKNYEYLQDIDKILKQFNNVYYIIEKPPISPYKLPFISIGLGIILLIFFLLYLALSFILIKLLMLRTEEETKTFQLLGGSIFKIRLAKILVLYLFILISTFLSIFLIYLINEKFKVLENLFNIDIKTIDLKILSLVFLQIFIIQPLLILVSTKKC